MRQKFTTLRSTVVPLPVENIDTDQIIPARFLKATTREGFGENLFRDWRYDKDGSPKEDFVMNSPIYKGEILVAGVLPGSLEYACKHSFAYHNRQESVVQRVVAENVGKEA